jgi:hypothetical protein
MEKIEEIIPIVLAFIGFFQASQVTFKLFEIQLSPFWDLSVTF